MTTNQTIDGVPRHWAEIEAAVRGAFQDGKKDYNGCMRERLRELRALLDAPASVESLIGRTGGGMVWHECAMCHTKGSYHPDVKWCVCGRPFELPAAQPQGEPLAHTMKSVMQAYENAQALHLTGTSNFCAVMAKHLNKHAEQPAQVAVVLTDEQIFSAMREPIYDADGGYVVDTARENVVAAGRALIACLDELTSLNTKE